MLAELRVENYAVIDHVAVEFGPGLNLLTGETGAGKSILIDALSLLLGERGSPDVIRHGSDKAVLSAVFEIEGKGIAPILEANGIDDAGDELILRREIAAGGRTRVFINNQPATVAVLKQLAPSLASVHAQNESILGFDAAARLALLDAFADSGLEPLAQAFAQWRSIRDCLEQLERDDHDRLRLLDLWSFQKNEIESARLQAGEDERLEAEKRLLANAEKIYAAAMRAYDLLYESEAAAAASLRAAARQLEELARYEPRFQEALASLDSARIAAEDVGAMLRDYAGGLHASPERLSEVEDRLAQLDRMKRKYGRTLAEVMAYGEDVAGKLNEIENKDEVMRRLRQELAAAGESYLTLARSVSRRRGEAARRLEKLVEAEINDLAMKAAFKVELAASEAESDWTATGFDAAAYLISTNPGEPLLPVERIASGGELSRVMLALRATVESATRRGRSAPQRTLIFDEIDTGIGGRAAESVGRKLKLLARTHQVLCVTHLPQIASFADQHFQLSKREVSGRVRTRVQRLDPAERAQELARMLSGAKVTDASLKHAEQLLKANA